MLSLQNSAYPMPLYTALNNKKRKEGDSMKILSSFIIFLLLSACAMSPNINQVNDKELNISYKGSTLVSGSGKNVYTNTIHLSHITIYQTIYRMNNHYLTYEYAKASSGYKFTKEENNFFNRIYIMLTNVSITMNMRYFVLSILLLSLSVISPLQASSSKYSLRKYAHVKEFYRTITPIVLQISKEKHIPPTAVLAIAGLESGYGQGYVAQITGNILSLVIYKSDPELPALYLPYSKSKKKILFDSKTWTNKGKKTLILNRHGRKNRQ